MDSEYSERLNECIADHRGPGLGTFLWDLGRYTYRCLIVLDQIGRISHGRSELEHTGSDMGLHIRITADSADIEDYLGGSRDNSVPFAEFRSAVERLWVGVYRGIEADPPERAFRPDLPVGQADLLRWEEATGRRHPYRGRIEGIPAAGPE
ncbi:hypothetical protein [Glycomyces buryatensis]|uniref:Uncharacterized protein n=1 Tax=Glycomyces buryatensis TaxID=2570927 RepID=A0A4S8Q9A5_9ACTN|nr:hypothetical protein [Glycomyces buryatensis]THV40908.1 hypothetical protein FAB82_13735 [Glycomyces buryatensis]